MVINELADYVYVVLPTIQLGLVLWNRDTVT